MNRSNLDLLMTTLIACMDELDPQALPPEEHKQCGNSPISDEEILCHWMVDLWSHIDQVVVDETNQLQRTMAENAPSSGSRKQGSARLTAELSIEMGLPDLATLTRPRSGSARRMTPKSSAPGAHSWCLFPGPYNAVMDLLSRRC